MPVTFHSLGSVNSAPSSLRSDTLSTPPVSRKSFEDIPFKAPDDDHVSLSMKKRRTKQHRRHDTLPRRVDAAVRSDGRRPKSHTSGSRHRSRDLRKTYSLPSVQPRFGHGAIETLEAPANLQRRPRRWTVPSKGASTCGLATL